jgi:YidC/Oxa1 family membrane protein insertase
MLSFFHTILYVPIYNILIFFASMLTHGDMGVALICAAAVVRLIILPLSLSAIRTQRAIRAIEPELNEIKEKYKEDPQKQASEQFALYKKYNIRPFASLLTVFIQLPVLISLYLVVRHESLTHVNASLLYPFIHAPAVLSPLFLGIFLITAPNLLLAVLAAISQFFQAYFAIPVPKKAVQKKGGSAPESMQQEFGRAMALQARFVLPVVIGIISYSSGAIALYFITTNVIMVLQEVLVRTTIKPFAPAKA